MFFARNMNYNIDKGKVWCVSKFSKPPVMSCTILSNSFFFYKIPSTENRQKRQAAPCQGGC